MMLWMEVRSQSRKRHHHLSKYYFLEKLTVLEKLWPLEVAEEVLHTHKEQTLTKMIRPGMK